MRVIRILWKHIISRTVWLIPLVIVSSSVYVTFVVTFWLQKRYLEKAHLYATENIEMSVVIGALVLFYISRCLSGGFMAPLSFLKDLYYDYILTRNVCLSQHTINNTVRLDYYESSQIWNLLVRVRQAFTTGALKHSLNTLGSLSTIVITLTSVLIALWVIQPVLTPFAVLSLLPMLYGHVVHANRLHTMQKRVIEKRRLQTQCMKHIIAGEYCLETRLANAAEYFLNQWEAYRTDIETEEMCVQLHRLRLDTGLNFVKIGCIMTIIGFSIRFLSQGVLSVGGFSAVIGLVGFMHASTSSFIRMVGNTYAQYKELADVAQYYELEQDTAPEEQATPEGTPATSTTVDTLRDGENASLVFTGTGISGWDAGWDAITLHDVAYKYPNRDEFAIKHINLRIHRGEKIALVGVNGAGKSTLINVLLGLFRPTQGKVCYGKHDIHTMHKPELYGRMTAIFQDFQTYALPIAENVKLGDVNKGASKEQISQALGMAGFNYGRYTEGIDTKVGKEFGGIGLSRGESQQIAIARSYFRDNAEIAVIDEPTAALDPVAEAELYRQFMANVEGKTAVIVSHRLGSTKIADRILVMDTSRIVEDGTHEELLHQGGLYAKMYTKQAALYERPLY